MGMSTKSIPFFTDDIVIDPHSATYAQHLKPISIRAFCAGQRVSLEQDTLNGEYIVRRADGAFIHGPEKV